MEKNNIILICGIVIIMGLIQMGSVWVSLDNKLVPVLNDTNTLKNNDVAFAQYITANSQTLEYLNNNCKVTNDTNEVTVLTCIKVK